VQQCDVLEHVFGMVLDARREQFDNSQAEEEAQKKAVLAARREHETLFDLGPGRGVTLIDEGLDFGLEPRDSASLSWATERLKSLQFEIVEDGATRRFIMAVGEYRVYADPRAVGRIKLIVYRPDPVGRRRASQGVACHTFEILDSWRNDLPRKLEARVAEAIEELSRKPSRRRSAR